MIIKFLIGIPASGKSTYALELAKNNPDWVRVNKDDIRASCLAGAWSKENEKKIVLPIRDSIIYNMLKSGKNVIVDDTNLQSYHFKTIVKIAHKVANETNQEVVIEKKYFPIPLAEAIERDNLRPASVGEEVVRRMYKDWENMVNNITLDADGYSSIITIKPLVSESDIVEKNHLLYNTIICDLDGTLCLFGDKNPYERDFENDTVNEAVRTVIHSYYKKEIWTSRGYSLPNIFFFSGRFNKYREVTNDWIKKHLPFLQPEHYSLCMRPDNDSRPDEVVKKEMFDIMIRNIYNVDFVIDDRNKVVQMWRNMGLTCLQVADGDF